MVSTTLPNPPASHRFLKHKGRDTHPKMHATASASERTFRSVNKLVRPVADQGLQAAAVNRLALDDDGGRFGCIRCGSRSRSTNNCQDCSDQNGCRKLLHQVPSILSLCTDLQIHTGDGDKDSVHSALQTA
jgi:hypothetical protein